MKKLHSLTITKRTIQLLKKRFKHFYTMLAIPPIIVVKRGKVKVIASLIYKQLVVLNYLIWTSNCSDDTRKIIINNIGPFDSDVSGADATYGYCHETLFLVISMNHSHVVLDNQQAFLKFEPNQALKFG